MKRKTRRGVNLKEIPESDDRWVTFFKKNPCHKQDPLDYIPKENKEEKYDGKER